MHTNLNSPKMEKERQTYLSVFLCLSALMGIAALVPEINFMDDVWMDGWCMDGYMNNIWLQFFLWKTFLECSGVKTLAECAIVKWMFIYAEQDKMERDVTPCGSKPERQLFLSPVLELTQSLQSLSTTRWDRHLHFVWLPCILQSRPVFWSKHIIFTACQHSLLCRALY